MSDAGSDPFDAIEATLKRVVATLDATEVPFLLGGALASWARGGPRPNEDLDLLVKPEDSERAAAALEEAGMRREDTLESWLVKLRDGGLTICLIHRMVGLEMSDKLIASGERLQVLSMDVRVMRLEDLLTSRLLALTEHALDYEGLLQIARALRERVNWSEVWQRTEASAYARGFFAIAEHLDIVPRLDARGRAGARMRAV